MIRLISRRVRLAGLMLVVLSSAGGDLRADLYTVTYGSGPGVTINYTGVSGQGTMALPFTVTDSTTGTSFTAYCVDLSHDQYSPATYTAPAYSVASLAGSSILADAFPNTGYADLSNHMNYVGTLYNALGSYVGDSEVAGAFQLALWTLIDKNFSYSTGDSVLTKDTQVLVDYLNGSTNSTDGTTLTLSNNTTVDLSKVAGIGVYSSSGNYGYANGELVLIHATPTSTEAGGVNQNLLTWGQDLHLQSVPEPSTFALAGLGALAFAGYALRRRAKA